MRDTQHKKNWKHSFSLMNWAGWHKEWSKCSREWTPFSLSNMMVYQVNSTMILHMDAFL